MNKVIFLALNMLVSINIYAQSDNWSAESTETQSQNTSQLIIKTSETNAKKLSSVMDKGAVSAQSKSTILHKQSAIILNQRPMLTNLNNEFWVYDAWITLRNDLDYDGYSYRFSVEIDADTIYTEADVYARLYLAKDDVFKEYHTTSVFRIFGESSEDSLIIDSELLQGFPSHDYELLIELYDAYSDELVAILDGNNDPDLYLIPLESKDYEYTEPVVVINEYGGSMGLFSLILLPLLVTRMRWYK